MTMGQTILVDPVLQDSLPDRSLVQSTIKRSKDHFQ